MLCMDFSYHCLIDSENLIIKIQYVANNPWVSKHVVGGGGR